jgi:hypothetical protein
MTNPPGLPSTRGIFFLAPCLAAALCPHGPLQGALVNPGFESGDLTGWSSLGTADVSTGYTYPDVVDVSPGASRVVSPNPGNFLAHLIASGQEPAENIASAMGIDLAALNQSNSYDFSEDDPVAVTGSLLYQKVSASAGDKFTFNWNFVERDFLIYDDWSFFGVSFDGGPASVSRLASVREVGPLQDVNSENTTVNGWKSFDFEIAESGDYTFYFGVVNAFDSLAPSELWIDAPPASISTIPEPGSVLGLGLLLGSGLLVRSRRRKDRAASI